jgi:NADH-ubiquinone oxidoreductase chain 5
MKEDPNQIRFFSYISLFTFFMIVLITSGNLIQLFIGWEGVGIVSYLLVNFWYSRIDANKSSIMAILTNKVGDISYLLAISIIFIIFKSFDFSIIFSLIISKNTNIIEHLLYYACFFFIIAGVGKSAQIGLHIWLPEAMEGPTPVSSLIHAATMVTAGIFLIIRCSFLFITVPNVLIWLILFGSITTFLGSSIGLFQYDIKKIIAYSTCSQLGYMFLSCGLIGFDNSIFHLINHAFFKGLLFLSAGSIIHCFSHEQDFRKMGNLYLFLPISYISILIGSLSLVGFPFLSGFYSKEKIIMLFFNLYINSFDLYFLLNWFFFFYFFSLISIVFTFLYSCKLIFFTFFNSYNGNKFYLKNISKESYILNFCLVILLYCSIFSGYLLQDSLIGIGSDFWMSSFYISLFDYEYFLILKDYDFYFNTNTINVFNYEFYKYIRQIPIIWIFYFFILYYKYYVISINKNYIFNIKLSSTSIYNLYIFFSQKWLYINKIIIFPLIDILFIFSHFSFLYIEKGYLESISSLGISNQFTNVVNKYSKLTKGLIYHYIGFILIGIFFMIFLTQI